MIEYKTSNSKGIRCIFVIKDTFGQEQLTELKNFLAKKM